MITDQLLARIAIAKAATPGPWKSGHTSQDLIFDSSGCVVAEARSNKWDINAQHIAANSPEAVIELCEELIEQDEYLHECNRMLGEAGAYISEGPQDGIATIINERDEAREELIAARARIKSLEENCDAYDTKEDLLAKRDARIAKLEATLRECYKWATHPAITDKSALLGCVAQEVGGALK